jgi:hypothetical protein
MGFAFSEVKPRPFDYRITSTHRDTDSGIVGTVRRELGSRRHEMRGCSKLRLAMTSMCLPGSALSEDLL